MEFIERHRYIPKVFQPYNCADVSELAPTVVASCGGSTTIGALYVIEEDKTVSDLQMIGRLDIKGNDQIKRVYGVNGISPTLTTCGGEHRSENFGFK